MLEYIDRLPRRRMSPRAQETKDLVEFAQSGRKCARITYAGKKLSTANNLTSYVKRNGLDVKVAMRGDDIYLLREEYA